MNAATLLRTIASLSPEAKEAYKWRLDQDTYPSLGTFETAEEAGVAALAARRAVFDHASGGQG